MSISRRCVALCGASILCVTLALSVFPAGLEAAPPAQLFLSFDAPLPISGTLDSATPRVSYMFQCFEGMIASIHVETTSGDLMTTIEVLDPGGQSFASGRVERKDPNISVAEGFAMPVDGLCSVNLTRAGNTAGTYDVRLLPGYAQLDAFDIFDEADNPLRLAWPPYSSENMDVAIENQRLRIMITTDNLVGYAVPDNPGLVWSDVYLQADFAVQGTPSYFEFGFLFRLNSAEDTFYLISISSDNDWSVFYYGTDWQTVQDYTVSDIIDLTGGPLRLGALVDGNTLKVFFNNQLLGEVTDTGGFAVEGEIALAAATTAEQTDTLTVFADNLIVTRPFAGGASVAVLPGGGPSPTPTISLFGLDSPTKPPEPVLQPTATPLPTAIVLPTATATRIPPTPTLVPTNTFIPPSPTPAGSSLTSWNSGNPTSIVTELRGLGIAPPGGSLQMTVPSSFGDTSSSGFNYYALGGGRRFRNFALGYDATLEISGAESGCGMHFRRSGNTQTSAMTTEDGAVFLIYWDSNGTFDDANSVLQYSDVVNPGVNATDKIVVVANEDLVTMYVNGQLAATGRFGVTSGTVALELFVAEDDFGNTQRTYCQLDNIWLWEF